MTANELVEPMSHSEVSADGAMPRPPRRRRLLVILIGALLMLSGGRGTIDWILGSSVLEMPIIGLIGILISVLTLYSGALLVGQGWTGQHPERRWGSFGMLVLAAAAATGFFIGVWIALLQIGGLGGSIRAAPPESWAARWLEWMVNYWYLIPVWPLWGAWTIGMLHVTCAEGPFLRGCRRVGYVLGVAFPVVAALAVVIARWNLA